jgi:threonine aldolase
MEKIMEKIDLRSDTVTQPTPAMRKAMAKAEVGDDVYGEDPTINRLQELAANKVGKEAALFVPSGTMGNLAAVLTHCGRGDEAIMGNLGHTFLFEAGGVSALGGVFPSILPNHADGTMALDDIRGAIRDDNVHHPISRLVILENTHNRCGGVPVSVAYTRSVAALVHPYGLKVHLDGARIFNASAALNVDARELAAPADSITFCLSKGLCAPAGSLLCGSRDFIKNARRIRKQLGGGMRQAGILAAAGIIALEQMVDRLEEDHIRARHIAEKLTTIHGIELDIGMPASNMVFLKLADTVKVNTDQVVSLLAEKGVLVGAVSPRKLRLVTHYWIREEAVDQVFTAFREVFLAFTHK